MNIEKGAQLLRILPFGVTAGGLLYGGMVGTGSKANSNFWLLGGAILAFIFSGGAYGIFVQD